jgi:hypothetical protein
VDLILLNDRLAICRLEHDAGTPDWASSANGFLSITRTAGELSIVCAESAVPPGVQCESAWCVFKIEGPLDFSLTGILASIAVPLAAAGVSIFAISTYDTDYVMVKEKDVETAVRALESSPYLHWIRKDAAVTIR